MAIVPKCCACAFHIPTSQYLKPHDQLFSSMSLYGNANSRTLALVLPKEGKRGHIGSVKASVCLSNDAIQSKANFRVNHPHEESTSGAFQFGVLIESLNELKEILGSNELELLERDIPLQKKQLGALKLFHDYLSRNLSSTFSDFLQSDVPLEKPKDNVIVRSGKSQERKLKRIKGLHKRVTDSKPSSFKDVKKSQKCQKRILSFGWRSVKRFTSKEECKLAEGIKVASELERIRQVIEKETGQPVSYADWAKAAKIDTGTLSRQLLHGSYCGDQLVQCMQPLVKYLVKKYIGIGIAPDDLLQAGNWGVLKGAEKFDRKKGRRFSAYIRHWIKKAVFEQIAQNSRIFRMPLNFAEILKNKERRKEQIKRSLIQRVKNSVLDESMVQKIEKAQRELHFNLGRYPRDEETANFTGFTLANVRLARRCSRSIGSLEQPIGHESPMTLKDIIPDKSEQEPSSMKRKQLKDGLLFILEELNPREKQILAQIYGLNGGTCRSPEEIGKHFSVSKEWIRTIETRVIAKLKRDENIKNNVRILLRCIETWC